MTEKPVDDVTFTIDGQEITVPKGTLMIRAAEQLGIIVPRFCDHPLLDPVGACRQCIVEVEGLPKPMMACTTTVMPDKAVKTHLTSDIARKGQEGTLEFLLINHPLDCPMCDKGGECPLQDQALKHGANTSRFIDQKRRYAKPVAVSAQVLLDRERCVLCARCTRFSTEISGDPFIELFERGALEQVAMYEDEPYDSYFSGNVIQICPVGALTSADYRFKARPFDVVTTPSVCDHCSAGCTLTVQSRRGNIQRQLARTNMAVNEAWNCDKGRFGYAHLTAETRVTEPKVREGSQLVTASWAQALTSATKAIAAATEAGPGRVAVVTGSRLADEDAYVVGKYTRTVLNSDDVEYRTRFAPADETDELTALIGRHTATYADVEHAPVIVVAGLDPEEEVPILYLRLRKAWRQNKAKIVVVGPHLGTLAGLAWRRVPTRPGEEAAALAALAGSGTDVADALEAADAPVVLVGERAGAGSVSAGLGLAEAVGGLLGHVPRRAGARGAVEAGLAAGALPGGRRLDDPSDRAELESLWGATLPASRGRDLHAILTDAAAGKIDVLHLMGVDLARDAASTELARKALAKVGTVIVQDLAATETLSEFADIVMPVTGRQERAGSSTDWEGRTQRFARAIDGPDLVQDDWEIVVQLAALQGHDLGFDDLDGIRGEIARLGRRTNAHDMPTGTLDAAAVDETTPESTAATGSTGSTAATGASGSTGATSSPVTTPAEGEAAGADPAGPLTAVIRPMLLDRGTMLTGATDLAATARAGAALLGTDAAAAHGLVDGDHVIVRGGSAELTLPVEVRGDVIAGVVVLPANSTDVPAWALADLDGHVEVTLERVATHSTDAALAEEVA
jgi:NADH-quinone oxidoreductase subunit G